MEQQHLVEIINDGSIAVVTMKRESKLNALNYAMINELIEVFNSLEKDHSLRGIILTGTGKSFVVGADISVMKECDPISAVEFISTLQRLMGTIRNLSIPVIAGVNGFCFGGGLELAISCDLVIASEDATFGMQEVKVGIPSVIEAALFPFVVGLNKTREMLLTGDVIGSQEAEKMGLVNYVVKKEDLLKACMMHAQRITVNSANAIALQKKLIYRWLENAGMELSVKAGIDLFGLSFAHEDANSYLKKVLK